MILPHLLGMSEVCRLEGKVGEEMQYIFQVGKE